MVDGQVLGVKHAAAFLGVSASTIRAWRAKGILADQAKWTRDELLAAVKRYPRTRRPSSRVGRVPSSDPGLDLNLPKPPELPPGGAELPPSSGGGAAENAPPAPPPVPGVEEDFFSW